MHLCSRFDMYILHKGPLFTALCRAILLDAVIHSLLFQPNLLTFTIKAKGPHHTKALSAERAEGSQCHRSFSVGLDVLVAIVSSG